MKSILSFDNYEVIETSYRFNPGFKSAGEEQIIPDFTLKIVYANKKKEQAILDLRLEMGDFELNKNSFYVKVRIIGNFSLEHDDALDDSARSTFFKANAAAILFPYMRSLVSDLTSKGSSSSVLVLPTMNIVQFLQENQRIQEVFLDDGDSEAEEKKSSEETKE
jgi:preprotein translocase subunit SecB